jgi:cytochrome b561
VGWRTGEHGYGTLAKGLHWVTVLALVAQLVIGYAMDADDSGQGRGRGRSGGSGRGRGGDDDALLELGWSLVTAHVALGALVLVLAVLRVLRRRYDGLPPWAATLSARERRIAHHTERALLALLFVVPLTGLALVAGDDDLLPLHVAAHVALYVTVAAHVGLVLKHQLVDRDRLLARMT